MNKSKTIITLSIILIIINIVACKTTYSTYQEQAVSTKNWVMLPPKNLSKNANSAQKATSILTTLLLEKGINITTDIKIDSKDDLLTIVTQEEQQIGIEQAKRNNYKYALSVTVEEWGYKGGLDNLPVIGITLKIIDTDTGKLIWSASGAKTGTPRQSISALAQKTLKSMLGELKIKN